MANVIKKKILKVHFDADETRIALISKASSFVPETLEEDERHHWSAEVEINASGSATVTYSRIID